MVFQVWKVERWSGIHSYSIRSGKGTIPVILNHDQFEGLFPDIDVEEIPMAPKFTSIEINSVIRV